MVQTLNSPLLGFSVSPAALVTNRETFHLLNRWLCAEGDSVIYTTVVVCVSFHFAQEGAQIRNNCTGCKSWVSMECEKSLTLMNH